MSLILEFLSWLVLDIILVTTGSYVLYALSFGRVNLTKAKTTFSQSCLASLVGLVFWIVVSLLVILIMKD